MKLEPPYVGSYKFLNQACTQYKHRDCSLGLDNRFMAGSDFGRER